jgi:cytochrome c553
MPNTVKVIGVLAGFAAVAACVLLIANSLARNGKDGQTKPGTAARSTSDSPLFGIGIPSGYRDWRLVSVAHEEGSLNDLRAILANDVAIKAYREGRATFPDGAIIARLAWSYVPSEENNLVFGRAQSFVAGSATDWYLQFMVKDSKKYAATEGWGFAQFDKDGKPADAARLKTCFSCHDRPNHEAAKAHDFVFTHYAP